MEKIDNKQNILKNIKSLNYGLKIIKKNIILILKKYYNNNFNNISKILKKITKWY